MPNNNPDISRLLQKKLGQVERWARSELPRRVGREAVEHFKENFDREGFVDGDLKKWPDVKRRDPGSKWYGFDYRGEKRTSVAFSRDRKTGKTRRAKRQKKLNFSRAATRRKILNGPAHALQDSLRYVPTDGGVRITSDKPYADLHNKGGTVKVFGRGTAHIPARPFVGDSKELNAKIDKIVDEGLDKILRI